MRGATASSPVCRRWIDISIHAPHAGCDLVFLLLSSFSWDFNPRTPCGVRLHTATVIAPHGNFNPRTPCGVRRMALRRGADRLRFQSTHPMRGATRTTDALLATRLISIHAPHAGCDVVGRLCCTRMSNFNPRTPCGVRPRVSALPAAGLLNFNPRTPCGVRRYGSGYAVVPYYISIHAPHAGCDFRCIHRVQCGFYFNPRTPCGVRPQQLGKHHTKRCISIHAPHAGCDPTRTISSSKHAYFNPRTPCGVRPCTSDSPLICPTISIHAPHAGCDSRSGGRLPSCQNFNPRTPCGVRLGKSVPFSASVNFNPRTPCGVRRCAHGMRWALSNIFQSTHPMRGATCALVWRGNTLENFNPRTPCGVRHFCCVLRERQLEFQSTHPMRGATGSRYLCVRTISISIHAPHAGCDAVGQVIASIATISIHAPHAGCDSKTRQNHHVPLHKTYIVYQIFISLALYLLMFFKQKIKIAQNSGAKSCVLL